VTEGNEDETEIADKTNRHRSRRLSQGKDPTMKRTNYSYLKKMVPGGGFEPPTRGFSIQRMVENPGCKAKKVKIIFGWP